MHAPQIIWLVLVAASVGLHIAKHGDRREPYSMWNSLADASLSAALLYWGGFFNG